MAHVDGVRPEIISVRPCRLCLQVENETQGDISLAIERLNTGTPNTRLGKVQTSDSGKHAQLEFELGVVSTSFITNRAQNSQAN